MSAKKKSGSGKRVAKRVEAAEGKRSAPPQGPPREAEKPRIAPRIQEQDSGLGVLKAIGIGIIVLIVGAGVLSRVMGGRGGSGSDRSSGETGGAAREEEVAGGDKLPGERCNASRECRGRSVCYSYRGEARRCYATCSAEDSCDPGYRCFSAAEQTGRRKTRVISICVVDEGDG